MKLLANILAIMLCFCLQAEAQTFTSRLQKVGKNQARITITQSSEIEKLVNGNSDTPQADNKTTATPDKPAAKPNPSKPDTKPEGKHETVHQDQDEHENPEGNTRKVMANGHKVMGYRVQAFAGGNTRADRTKAQEVSNAIKKRFPNEPVYVHFYSPRWICRVGNYRTYEEAHQMLTEIRNMGYGQAFIVKGKITVQY